MNRLCVRSLLVLFVACLFQPTCLIAQEKETVEEAVQEIDPADQVQQDPEAETDKDLVLAQQVKTMILNGETRDALGLIDRSLAEDPEKYTTRDVQRSYAMVVAGFNRIRNAREVYKTLNKLLEYQFSRLEKKDEEVRVSGTIRSMLGLVQRLDKQDEVGGILDRAVQATEAMAEGSDNIQVAVELSNLRGLKAALLVREDKKDEAFAIYQAERERLKQLFDANPDDELARAVFLRSVSDLMRISEDDSRRDAFYDEHQSIVKKYMNEKPDDMSLATQYLAALLFRAGAILESDPNMAIELVDEGEKVLADVIVANAEAERALQPVKIQLAAFRKRAEGQLVIVELIDKAAPALDAEFWVNGEELTADNLKGKVIMLDFWAVWCRPCILTFPKIKELNETYASQGLQIVGVTSRYNIAWDDEKLVPKQGEGEVAAVEEVEAIRKFMEKFELPYPSIVTPKESSMGESFGVTGMPHVVLIDKLGKIRLVKVGGNEKNADAIEEKIKELLAE